jgi:hypothetical protein
MVTWSWGAFFVYLSALCLSVLGGFWGLVESRHPAFLVPILMGLFFFYITWKIVVDENEVLGPPSKQR